MDISVLEFLIGGAAFLAGVALIDYLSPDQRRRRHYRRLANK